MTPRDMFRTLDHTRAAARLRILRPVKLHCLSKSAALLVAAVALTASGTASAAELFTYTPAAVDDAGCGGTGCWSNYIRVADLDQDGALDIVEPNYFGFFGEGGQQPLLIFFGDGEGNFTNESSAAVGDFEGRLRQVAIADITGDGYPDIYAPDGFNGSQNATDVLFINQGDGTFIDEAETRLPDGGGAPGSAGGVRFADLDGDWDLDIFVADGYGQGPVGDTYVRIFLNDGTGVFTEGGTFPTGAVGVANDPDDVDIFDVDRDWDLDVLINMHGGRSQLWLNDGAGNFTDATDNFTSQPSSGFHYNPGICDVDNDGDLDVWIDNMASGYREQLSINDGTGVFTDETNARVNGNISGADDNGVACADVDNDGDFDAVIFNLFGGGGVERVLFNDGTGNFSGSPQADEFSTTNDATLWGEAGDFDGDGRLDWVTAQGEQSGPLRVYLGAEVKPVDEQAPEITHGEVVEGEQAEDFSPWLRFAVRDEIVNDSGPLLDAAWISITVGGEEETAEAWFLGGDLFVGQIPAQAAGAEVTYAFCARDRAGNEGCGEDIVYTIEGGTADTTGEETTGEETTTEGGSESGTDTTGESESDTAADEVGTEDTGGDAMADEGGDAGCACSTDSGSPAQGGVLGLLGLLGLGLLRRRRD